MTTNMDGSCERCGGPLRRERVVRAFDAGLPDVIVSGLERASCEACGSVSMVYPRPRELLRIVFGALLDKAGRLSGPEIAWLRGAIGLRGKDLAEVLGVTPAQVSRWENGAAPVSNLADRLVRAVVADKRGVPLPNLRRIDPRRAGPVSLRIALDDDGWHVVAPERAAV